MIPILTDPVTIIHTIFFGILVGASVAMGVFAVYRLFKRWM